jgi:hypothetical protein
MEGSRRPTYKSGVRGIPASVELRVLKPGQAGAQHAAPLREEELPYFKMGMSRAYQNGAFALEGINDTAAHG